MGRPAQGGDEAKGDSKAVAAATSKLAAQQQWLDQARAGLDEFSG